MEKPTPEIARVLLEAAARHTVPYTLLCAIAWVESRYDSQAIATSPSGAGEGLFQLGPAMIARYSLADPLDLVAAADAGALLLSRVGRGTRLADDAAGATGWKSAIGLFYFAAHGVAQPDRKPELVRRYTLLVQGCRQWLQNNADAEPQGATIAERLGNAIEGLALANPTNAEAKQLKAIWSEYAGKRTIVDDSPLEFPELSKAWKAYARIYDQAVVSDERTPPPITLQPTLSGQVDETKARIKETIDDVLGAAGRAAEYGALGLLAVLAIVWIAKK